jgi:hypothetical protein
MRTGIDSRIGRFEGEPLCSIIELRGQRSRGQGIPKSVSGLTISRMLVGRYEYLDTKMKASWVEETIAG